MNHLIRGAQYNYNYYESLLHVSTTRHFATFNISVVYVAKMRAVAHTWAWIHSKILYLWYMNWSNQSSFSRLFTHCTKPFRCHYFIDYLKCFSSRHLELFLVCKRPLPQKRKPFGLEVKDRQNHKEVQVTLTKALEIIMTWIIQTHQISFLNYVYKISWNKITHMVI